MKVLKRNDKGRLIVETRKSPIVSKDNFPLQLVEKKAPKKEDVAEEFSQLTVETLLEKMKEAGGKDLTTSQFAILIAPKVKASEDAHAHHIWDMAHSEVRRLMRKLQDQGLVEVRQDPDTNKPRYLFDLTKKAYDV